MDKDRPRLPANRNCYRLSRVSWALAQISCYHWPTQLTHLICTDLAVNYRDALDRFPVCLNSILFRQWRRHLDSWDACL